MGKYCIVGNFVFVFFFFQSCLINCVGHLPMISNEKESLCIDPGVKVKQCVTRPFNPSSMPHAATTNKGAAATECLYKNDPLTGELYS